MTGGGPLVKQVPSDDARRNFLGATQGGEEGRAHLAVVPAEVQNPVARGCGIDLIVVQGAVDEFVLDITPKNTHRLERLMLVSGKPPRQVANPFRDDDQAFPMREVERRVRADLRSPGAGR